MTAGDGNTNEEDRGGRPGMADGGGPRKKYE